MTCIVSKLAHDQVSITVWQFLARDVEQDALSMVASFLEICELLAEFVTVIAVAVANIEMVLRHLPLSMMLLKRAITFPITLKGVRQKGTCDLNLLRKHQSLLHGLRNDSMPSMLKKRFKLCGPWMPDLLTPSQVRAGRGMLDWSRMDLAKAARLSVSAIHRFEIGDDQPSSKDIVALIRDALETEGVQFLSDVGNGPGVRFRQR